MQVPFANERCLHIQLNIHVFKYTCLARTKTIRTAPIVHHVFFCKAVDLHTIIAIITTQMRKDVETRINKPFILLNEHAYEFQPQTCPSGAGGAASRACACSSVCACDA